MTELSCTSASLVGASKSGEKMVLLMSNAMAQRKYFSHRLENRARLDHSAGKLSEII